MMPGHLLTAGVPSEASAKHLRQHTQKEAAITPSPTAEKFSALTVLIVNRKNLDKRPPVRHLLN